jgi:hypothetical protein
MVLSTIEDHDTCEMYHVMRQTFTLRATNISQITGLGIEETVSLLKHVIVNADGSYVKR